MIDETKQNQYLTVRETAKALGVHENTVRNWVRAGTLRSSRVPGSSAHRFERTEVERLQKERGAETSSIAPMLRMHSPELIGPTELDRWAGSEDAKGAFPELMSRLLAATPGITNTDVRSHEGVAAPGWDGRVTSTGTGVLPSGTLRFELGTTKEAKSKAQRDYDKRVEQLPRDADATLVFATPRNWPHGQIWADERAAQKQFQGVRVLDAHSLATWLRATPAVHYWISERMGYQPRDAKTINRWHTEFDDRITVLLPPSFFLAGRSAEAGRLRDLLSSADTKIVTVRAPWIQEAIAFLHAVALTEEECLDRHVIVEDAGAWHRIVESNSPLILIPLFDDPDLRLAETHGHRVVLVVGTGDPISNIDVDLPKVDPQSAAEALKNANPGIQDEYRLVALARRSLPALVRSIARDPRRREPEWTRDQAQSETLSRLMLAGVWTTALGDQQVTAQLVGRSADEIERLLQHLATRTDAPFVLSGGIWRLTSPVEAGLLFFTKLTANDMSMWKDALLKVLLEPDPYRGMDTANRLTSSARGTAPQYSSTLRQSLADGLALAAASPDVTFPSGRSGQEWVDDAVRALLAAAEADTSGATWERLADVLPVLAEAAPEVFLDAVESDLDQEHPALATMFKDLELDALGSSSPHSGLLWALEGLCWEPTLFARAALELARLAAIDPGGRLSNRPLESLKNVTAGWIRHSGAEAREKIDLIDVILQRLPEVGWKLLIAVWPSTHALAFSPHSPKFKDWKPANTGVSGTEWTVFLEGLTDLALRYADSHPERWRELVEKAPSLPASQRIRLMKGLATTPTTTWSTEEQFAVWETLRNTVDRHEEYSDAQWALPSKELEKWRALATALEPRSDPRRYSDLFDWRTRIGDLSHSDEGFEEELNRQQREAVDVVLSQGIEALKILAMDVKIPRKIGEHAAEASAGSFDREILSWLNTDEHNLREAALALAASRIFAFGLQWLRTALTWPEIGTGQSGIALMSAVPATASYWSDVPALGEDLETAYWSAVSPYSIKPDEYEEAVHLLIEHGRPWSALTVLANAVDRDSPPSIELVKAVFAAVGNDSGPIGDLTMTSYNVEQLLTYLEAKVPEDPDLPQLEFFFFDFLHDHQPSGALYRHLSNSPTEFVDLVKLVFRAEGEPLRELTGDASVRAHIAFSVLREWSSVPGQQPDGTVDADQLSNWVRAARLAFADNGRSAIGDEVIGEILSASPEDSDGIWPVEAIRDLVETIGSARLDTGLNIGLRNRRGVTSRGVFDGGQQEWELAKKYKDMSMRANAKWRRTARILRSIADSYRDEARFNDARAEERGDHG